jgi:predicted O-methyltransferase YrrM
MTDSLFQAVLDEYNARARREAEVWSSSTREDLLRNRDQFLLHIGEDVGRFLHSLLIARRAKHIVEIGTSYGYSTLFLADAARTTGGRVSTIELSESKQAHARAQLQKAKLADHVDWLNGDALGILERIEGPIDFVLLDLWKELYVPCLERFLPKLAENGIIAADNMLQPEVVRPQAEIYRAAVRAVPWLQSVLLPIGQGIELSCAWRTAPAAGAA